MQENKIRYDSGIPYPANKGYGEALDPFSAQKYESILLKDVAKRIYDVAEEQGKSLRIVLLNHYRYNGKFKRITAQAIREFAKDNSVMYLELSTDFLTMHKNFYTDSGPHFNAFGYNEVGQIILDWLRTGPAASTVR